MKKTGFFIAFSFISFLAVAQVQRVVPQRLNDSTQSRQGNNGEGKMNRKKMMRELNLTREQRSKLKEIKQSNLAKKDEISNDDKLTDEQKKVKLKELKRGQVQSTMTILNDEQKAKMRMMRGKRHQFQNN